jgi:hypothetical protein
MWNNKINKLESEFFGLLHCICINGKCEDFEKHERFNVS